MAQETDISAIHDDTYSETIQHYCLVVSDSGMPDRYNCALARMANTKPTRPKNHMQREPQAKTLITSYHKHASNDSQLSQVNRRLPRAASTIKAASLSSIPSPTSSRIHLSTMHST
jgi:hypothetical protein